MPLPNVAPHEVIQVVMTGAFYTAHFKPLLERQDFTLGRLPGTEEESEADLATYVIALGESRANMMITRRNRWSGSGPTG